MSSFASSQSVSSPLPMEKSNSTQCYVQDVLQSMLNDQSDHVYSKFSDSYIKYRKVVVEWMVDVAEYFDLHLTTTHAAIAYLDRLQPNEKYSRFEWQMMAICCLIISSKYNECEEHVPPLHKLEEITQQAMTNECVLNYELWALKRMGWKLNARTPIAFLDSYLYLAQRLPDIDASHMSCFRDPDFESAVSRMATKCIVNDAFKPLPASSIATGILFFVRETFFCKPLWTPALSRLTGHDAPSSKSVQKVLQLLDAMVQEERRARQEQLLQDSSLEESREECSLEAALEGMRLEQPEICRADSAAEGEEEEDPDRTRTASDVSTEHDDENTQPTAFASAASRVLGLFGASAPTTKAATQNTVTPAATVKTVGGEGAPEKTKFSPVSIADFL